MSSGRYAGQRTDGAVSGGYTGGFIQPEGTALANNIAAHRHRTRLHVLRDRLERALRDEKRGLAGAAERVKAHSAKRAEYRAAHP